MANFKDNPPKSDKQESAVNAGPNIQAIIDSNTTPEEYARKHPNVPVRDDTTRPIDPLYDSVTEDTHRKTKDKVEEIQQDLRDNPSDTPDLIHEPGPEAVIVASPTGSSPSKPSAEPQLEGVDLDKVPNHPSVEKSRQARDDEPTRSRQPSEDRVRANERLVTAKEAVDKEAVKAKKDV